MMIGVNLILLSVCFFILIPMSVYIYLVFHENVIINLPVDVPMFVLPNVLCLIYFFTMLSLLMRKFAPLLGLKPNIRFDISENSEPAGLDSEKDMEKMKLINKILLYVTYTLFAFMIICALFANSYFKYAAIVMVFYYIAYFVFVLYIAFTGKFQCLDRYKDEKQEQEK